MSVEHIRNVILTEARAEAEKAEAEANARHAAKLEAARKALDEEFAERLDQAQHDAAEEGRREVIRARAERNFALLKRRNEILDDLFARAARRLADLPDEKYRAVMEKWLRKLPPDVGGRLCCNERDVARLKPVVDKLNKDRPKDAGLELAQSDRALDDAHGSPLIGGAVLHTERFEVDLSVDALVKQLRESLAPEVSKIVFPEDVSV